jgi:DNA-binding transcriptional LysR family regulator
MSHRLPPLNGLRSFEAAARHLSFTRAADELGVTAGAVSQQVKSLEGALGVTLFRRLPRSLVLTGDGEAYLPAITLAFETISRATEMTAPAFTRAQAASGRCRQNHENGRTGGAQASQACNRKGRGDTESH